MMDWYHHITFASSMHRTNLRTSLRVVLELWDVLAVHSARLVEARLPGGRHVEEGVDVPAGGRGGLELRQGQEIA
eukprot:scaffold65695_cov42-Prasinocladus_malaysianus.AAC.1